MVGQKPTVLSVFDYTGNFVLPWAEYGFPCIVVDTKHPDGWTQHPLHPNITRVGADVRTWLPPRDREYALAAFWPPCTDMAVSGARWFRGKGLFALADSIRLFGHAANVAEWLGAPYVIENPVSTISTYWRKPDETFDPADFAGYLENPEDEAYTKKTCLWTGHGFTMPPKRSVEATQGSKMHLMAPSPDRAELRSATPVGFARAVFQHINKEYVLCQGEQLNLNLEIA